MARGQTIRYPRRRVVRGLLRGISGVLIRALSKVELVGREHVPPRGKVILAANHFDFIDPALVLYASPRMVEFIGGANRPNSPGWAQKIPKAWGFIPAYRGGFSRSTFDLSLSVLDQGGVLGIFPEGGSWANLLRPARPGLPFIAEKSGASVVPVSISGAENVLGGPRRALTIRFHPPVAPPTIAQRIPRRAQLDDYGEHIMSVIASGLPDTQRGKFSSDPDAQAAALAVSDFPFHGEELRGG